MCEMFQIRIFVVKITKEENLKNGLQQRMILSAISITNYRMVNYHENTYANYDNNTQPMNYSKNHNYLHTTVGSVS